MMDGERLHPHTNARPQAAAETNPGSMPPSR